ncbi:GDP-mannose 4,6-dehydratase [Candidatus Micrarchaeota archaeon]|nr:GDP-mannose 4,6-dehydratase [Candidatus Micrarchaeota archaeon]
MKILITGGLGFLGSNLAHENLKRGHETIIMDNLSRDGTNSNLAWLEQQGNITLEKKDIRVWYDVQNVIQSHKPDAIFHAAGQVTMTRSIANPRLDFETNALGTFNVLEAVRQHKPECPVLFSSTNKVYGDLEYVKYEEKETRYLTPDYSNGFDETIPLDFHSPYGCSKGCADQYLLDYHRIYDLRTVVFRHSSMYGSRQFATFDQGWVGWFIQQALKANEMEIHGNGKQVRDVLYADDMVRLYFDSLDNIEKCQGNAYNIGGGMENSLSLLELFAFLEQKLGKSFIVKKNPWRESDQKVFVADNTKINKVMGWKPEVSKEKGLLELIKWSKEIM